MANKKDRKKAKEAKAAKLASLNSKKVSLICTSDAASAGEKVCVLVGVCFVRSRVCEATCQVRTCWHHVLICEECKPSNS